GEGAAKVDELAVEAGDGACEIFEAVGSGRGVGDQRFLDGLAGVEGFEPRQRLVAVAQDIGGAAEDAAALDRLDARPFGLRGARRFYRQFDDVGRGRMQRGDALAGGRIDDGNLRAAIVVDIATVDI